MMHKHVLIILSSHDVQAECSCGRWYLSYTGPMTREQIKEEHRKHLSVRRLPSLYKLTAFDADGFGWSILHDGTMMVDPKWVPLARKMMYAVTDLLMFAQLISDFFDGDSSGHARYLKEQADNMIARAIGRE